MRYGQRYHCLIECISLENTPILKGSVFLRKFGRNEPCWCGSGRKYKNCHSAFDSKLQSYKFKGAVVPPRSLIKNEIQIQGIRESGKINTAILDYISKNICAGITTEQIDKWVYEETVRHGAMPATLNYEGFPKSVCTSINEQVCHGIPSSEVILKDGDIINVDVSTVYQGYFSDSSRMFCIGEVLPEKRRLVDVTLNSISVGLEQVKPWGYLGDVGQAIHDYAKQNGFRVVREIGGHGIGLEFHEDPWVSYVSKRGTEMMMVPGMVFTIEPMLNMGTEEVVFDMRDGWSVYTADGQPSAQWEVQVLVTETGYEILAY